MSSLRTLRGIAASAHAVSSDSESRGTTQGGAESAGVEEVHSFQAETRRLLDIVTNSLYTDKEVFVRELVSNASDALEKCRHAHLAKGADPGALEVTITTDDALRRFTITDSGMGMSRADLVSNLGTIARSGSKAFVDELSAGGEGATASTNIIGKFGVGFYSAFMVSERVDVFSSTGDGVGWKWSSSGDGTYTLASCGVELRAPVGGNADAKTNGEEDEVGGKAPWRGTRVVLHVKEADRAIAAAGWAVENTLKKYSAFVGFPVNLNGRRTNDIDALWTKRANEVSDEDATTFYRFVGGALDAPAFRLHFSADAPLTIRALLFAPSENPEKGFAARGVEGDQSGLSLYSRRVLIQANARGLLPGFMRWVRGVVDCEDVPLNISRESLQDSDLVRRLGEIITRRMIKFLGERAKKEPERYAEWYAKMGVFIKEGVCGDQSYAYKESLVPLLRFDSSRKQEEVEEGSEPKSEADGDGGKPAKPAQVSLDEYVARMPAGQKDIYYLVSSGGRKQAESSPYLELTRAKGYEVLFLYAHVDEFVMQHVRRHKGKDLVSVEVAELEDDADAKKEGDADGKSEGEGEALGEEAMEKLCQWFAEKALPGRVTGVKSSSRLRSSPALLVGHEPEAMRRYRLMLTMMQDDATATKLDDLQSAAGLELNPRHAIMRAIDAARASSDPEAQRAAQLVAEQVFDNARVAAGALSDPREMVGRINQILELALPKPSTPPIP
uniref:Histidine kinase/HSP90-like ATPase domain-containing protein n=1 Tax=Mantoniella antarctica TaxID=81844 RepID=A0A7S0S9I5_9CHLO